jgi:hypothetical protein
MQINLTFDVIQKPRINPATIGNWIEQNIKPIENKDYECGIVQNRFSLARV